MKTIHFVYVRGSSTAAPMSITNHLSAHLKKFYEVIEYDWLDDISIVPSNGDILLGHPHPAPNTAFQRSFTHQNFVKRIVMCPLAHAMPEYIAFLDNFIEQCDLYLAITGNYWMRTLSESMVSHWSDKIVQLDLAIDPKHFAPLQRRWNPPGMRKILYIGSTGKNKGSDLIGVLADKNPSLHLGWIGHGKISSSRLVIHGPQDLSSESGRAILKEYDFLLHMGRSDANPTTILEGLAWGILPVCTPQSGYEKHPWLTSVPLRIQDASTALLNLQTISTEELEARLDCGREALRAHYNWDRFGQQVRDAVEGTARKISPVNSMLFTERRASLRSLAKRKALYDSVRRQSTRAFQIGRKVWAKGVQR